MLKRFLINPLVLFFVAVFALEWIIVLALFPLSPMAVGIIAFVPAPAAILVVAFTEGRKGLKGFVRRCFAWRVKAKWYVLAILIPLTIHLIAAVVALLFGAKPALHPETLIAYLPLTLVLAASEEIGWQGYAIPNLRAVYSPLLTAVIFGVLHAIFHLPMYLMPLPAELRQTSPFPLFLIMATAFALFRVWYNDHTDGNLLLIIIYHAAINTSVLFLAGVETDLVGWLIPVVWALAAVPILFAYGLKQVNLSKGRQLRMR